MKRKDWISISALLLILGVAFIGEQFCSNGLWEDAAINLSLMLLPLVVFYIIAVVARNRKGSYVQFWRMLSYVCIIVTVFFLFKISIPFMHYFNVQNRQDKVKEKAEMIIADCDNILNAYNKQVTDRYTAYSSDLQSAVNENQWSMLQAAIPDADLHASNFVASTSDSWKVNMFSMHHSNMKKNWANLKPQFQRVLIDDFDAFTAARQVNELANQYNDFKKKLTEDFKNLTPLEKKNNLYANGVPQFNFENKEDEWLSVNKLFTETEMNVEIFIVFFLLALFACSGYIFFKDDTVKVSQYRKNGEVYEQGHRL